MDLKCACILFFFLAVSTCEASPVESNNMSKRGVWDDIAKTLIKLRKTLDALRKDDATKAIGDGCVEVRCLADPCQDASCPGESDAVCKTNNCGECKAEFYLGDTLLTKERCSTSPIGPS